MFSRFFRFLRAFLIVASLKVPCANFISFTFTWRRRYSYNRDAASFFQLLSQQFLGRLNNERASIQFSEEYHRQECKDPRTARLMALPPRNSFTEVLFILDDILFVALCSCGWNGKSCRSVNVSRFLVRWLILVSFLKTDLERISRT